MPYITKGKRIKLTDYGSCDFPEKPGELNFNVTQACLRFIDDCGLNYNDGVNAVIGVLECAKLEFYRRLGGDYEDQKIKENGDLKLYEKIRKDNGLSKTESYSGDERYGKDVRGFHPTCTPIKGEH